MNQIVNVRELNIAVDSSFRRVHKIAKNDSWLCHVCVSICMEHLSSHWVDFHEI
jgi:hypothetical protein